MDIQLEQSGKEFRIGDYVFKAASSATERLGALRLRSFVYVEEGFVDPRDLDGQLLEDAFDAHSIMLVGCDLDGRVVGTTRYVLPGPMGLPVERLFSIDGVLPPRDCLGEFSRLAIDSEHRGGSRTVMLGLIASVAQCAKDHGTDHFLAFLPVRLIEYFASLGFVGHLPPVLPPSAANLQNRRLMRGYFAKAEVRPILYSQRDTEDTLRSLFSEF